MTAPVPVAGVEGAAADPLTAAIGKLTHELSVLPLQGEKLAAGDSFNLAAFTLTNYTFWLILAVLLVAVFFILGARRASLVPKGIGNLAEAGVEFVRNSICIDVMGPEGAKYFPFIGTIFFFVLFNNLLGNVPPALPGTGTVGTTFTWGIIVFLVYNAIGIKKNGALGYLKSFIPSGTPGWLKPFMFLLEIISHTLRPVTLGVRLFANMYAGHIMLGVFAIFCALTLEHFTAVGLIVLPLSFVMQVVLRAFELFVAVLQAYIFSILTAVYINGALHASEH
ncbi:MAG: F0F1 ATP synthase subunit A [Coriobacteriia bacterium]|nr:F0F1 ATP synthase subunit A [Coriobacteriia bacterium]